MRSPSLAAVDKALYEDRTVIRHHGMRRTLWVSTPEVVRLIHAAATRDLIPAERRRTSALLAASGIDDPERWLDDAAEQVLADLHEHGPSTARELGQRVEALRHPLQLSPGKKWAATQSAHVRVLLALCLQGKLVRGKPVGSWINGAYRYAAADFWLPGGLGDHQPRQAAAELAGRWLRRFGPATTSDLQWWMGWTVARTKQALTDCRAVETAVDDGVGWLAQDDFGPVIAEPWVAVLPSLDPTTMGWKSRAWYLPAAASEAFDRNGNAGPTIWVDGRVVGAWAQDRQGEIRTHYFERVAASRRREVQARVAELQVVGWRDSFHRALPRSHSGQAARLSSPRAGSALTLGAMARFWPVGLVMVMLVGCSAEQSAPIPTPPPATSSALARTSPTPSEPSSTGSRPRFPDAAGPDRAGHSAGR